MTGLVLVVTIPAALAGLTALERWLRPVPLTGARVQLERGRP